MQKREVFQIYFEEDIKLNARSQAIYLLIRFLKHQTDIFVFETTPRFLARFISKQKNIFIKFARIHRCSGLILAQKRQKDDPNVVLIIKLSKEIH